MNVRNVNQRPWTRERGEREGNRQTDGHVPLKVHLTTFLPFRRLINFIDPSLSTGINFPGTIETTVINPDAIISVATGRILPAQHLSSCVDRPMFRHLPIGHEISWPAPRRGGGATAQLIDFRQTSRGEGGRSVLFFSRMGGKTDVRLDGWTNERTIDLDVCGLGDLGGRTVVASGSCRGTTGATST